MTKKKNNPYTTTNLKNAKQQHKMHPECSITQWFQTDLEESVGVTTQTKLVWLTGLRT